MSKSKIALLLSCSSMPAIVNPLDLSGKTVLVTGASSGIGRDACILLSELGAKVILVARRQDELVKTLESMTGEGHHYYSFDVTQVRETAAWMKTVAVECGPIDGIVCAAGATNTEAIRHLDFDKMDHLMDLNFKASMAMVHAVRQKQVRRKDGGLSVVLVSSTAGHKGFPGLSIYAATKGAIDAAVRVLAIELARESIRVNSVVPGLVQTEMVISYEQNVAGKNAVKAGFDLHPLGAGFPRDVSNALAFLLSDASRWITGTSLVVDGGRLA
ncbi:SDR family oxidoreductase [Prosthecobacter sp. SYSU 5D2]|uniref:SDR family NAD(P)-dependent oxidoreductase n=1 Tax=Prosthecobacter sp. SYSU 5D2 TaxID=3134134 RepID=UPI0031FF4101